MRHTWSTSLFFALVGMMLICSAPAYAGDKWDSTDLSLLAASTALFVVDWQQTRYVARNPDKYAELNPLMGRHPNNQTIDLTMAGTFLATVVIAELLPSKWRKIWLGGVVVVEAGSVINNVSIGIRF
jgi:hypothetical protein